MSRTTLVLLGLALAAGGCSTAEVRSVGVHPLKNAEGHVIDGAHSWLLADPDAFGEVITNDLAVARLAREMEEPAPRRRLFGGRGHPRRLASLAPDESGDEPLEDASG